MIKTICLTSRTRLLCEDSISVTFGVVKKWNLG